MKILYRNECESLEESMKNVCEYGSVEEMKAGITKDWNKQRSEAGFRGDAFSVEDVSISDDFGPDDRIGWPNTHFVCTGRMGEEDFMEKYGVPQAIGFCVFLD